MIDRSIFLRVPHRAIDYSRLSTFGTTTVPSGSGTTKYISRIGPLTVSEKQTSQKGIGAVRNSCVSNAPTCT
jgi:hypothetical protein